MHTTQNKQNTNENNKASVKQRIEVLKIRFDLPLKPNQIYQFRGAVADAAGWENNLFHNHGYQPPSSQDQPGAAKEQLGTAPMVEKKWTKAVFYRYPLIQYRSEGGQAAIWAMGEGINALRQWMNNGLSNFWIGGRKKALKITDFKGADFYLAHSETLHAYRLMDWLALNQANYQRWQTLERYSLRITLLEEILAGQLLSFATAAEWQVPKHFEVQLLNVRSCRSVKVHGTEKIAFNLLYKTNLLLPPNMAVGRSTAFGFGVQQPIKNSNSIKV